MSLVSIQKCLIDGYPYLRAATCTSYLCNVAKYRCSSNGGYNHESRRRTTAGSHNVTAIVTNPDSLYGRYTADVATAETGRSKAEIVGAAVGNNVDSVVNRRMCPQHILTDTGTNQVAVQVRKNDPAVVESATAGRRHIHGIGAGADRDVGL